MQTPPPRLLYLVHGAPSYYHEAAYSILSLWRQSAGRSVDVVVVTNDAQPLRNLLGDVAGLQTLIFTAQQQKDWIGPTGYIHRMKPKAFAWAMAQLDPDGRGVWAFVDSDTAFNRPPQAWLDAVAPGRVVLHAQEGTVAGNRSHSRSQRRLADALARAPIPIRGQSRQIAGQAPMWNSGVIGLHASQRDVLTDTVELIDSLYPLITIHTIEQVALSLVLQDRGITVETCDDAVLHYHTFKEFRGDLAQFFAHHRGASVDELLVAWPEINPAVRIVPKREFNALPKWRRKLKKYFGGGWKPLPLPWPDA